MYKSLENGARFVANSLALAGGGVLILLTAVTCISIVGRVFVPFDLGIGPIRGIYDITEIGIAAAVFAFLPLAQFKEAHARVDLFQWALPRKLDQALDVLYNGAMAFVAAVGTSRMYLGMQDKITYGETTLIAQIPMWQGYALALIGATGFVVVAIFCVLRSARRFAGLEE
jgi:TRAP-type C4-dicarboxylate transport system permease small subunit|tara:strand:- start:14826 stop:15338 length:513 start_codon:yes stop_codon:yes gene_type:complete